MNENPVVLLSDVLNARRQLKRSSSTFSGDWWPISYSGSGSYSLVFGRLLREMVKQHDPELERQFQSDGVWNQLPLPKGLAKLIRYSPNNPIKAWVEHVKKSRPDQAYYGLDLMGYGAILADLNIWGGAVALRDRRRPKDVYQHLALAEGTKRERIFIKGDIMSPKTWEELRKRTIDKKFDLITCRPYGGLACIPLNHRYYWYFLKNVYALLNPDRGLFLSEYNSKMTLTVKIEANRLNAIEGITAKCSHSLGAFLLLRTQTSPSTLPI